MDLIEQLDNQYRNLLPVDGIVHYVPRVLPQANAEHYLKQLLKEVAWQSDEVVLFGKTITTKRKVAWYGDEAFQYSYSGRTKTALPWLDCLQDLKTITEQACNERFNSCLLNLYHNGDEGMSWHSDAEPELKPNAAIATISLGGERKFSLKHKTSKQTVQQQLEPGSLLIMKAETQRYWLHCVPKTKKPVPARISLTFRSIET
ncbi:alpha-ketoglutarate-dependent dioxygenase AlkB family protein [Reinekea thalattae]|uniref:Alpha-ketoglutarate-dependent dioxygenase AlkB n=1 Tax=Reinekea thalattae TaxID=2593301 RepID=A0A5C8Z901_9GAMM|nr:alpha-ketoglutarate-dependent dioxygenase AlkB [Reinekea thalattae]TXR53631.1 alpha-ketoglutarate-dependent dioxygenase AlkB [Reinekea thalattae]